MMHWHRPSCLQGKLSSHQASTFGFLSLRCQKASPVTPTVLRKITHVRHVCTITCRWAEISKSLMQPRQATRWTKQGCADKESTLLHSAPLPMGFNHIKSTCMHVSGPPPVHACIVCPIFFFGLVVACSLQRSAEIAHFIR